MHDNYEATPHDTPRNGTAPADGRQAGSYGPAGGIPAPASAHALANLGGRVGGPPFLRRSELRTLGAAIRADRAIITEEERRSVPQAVAELAMGAYSPRVRLAAMRVWALLDGLNLRAEIAAAEAAREAPPAPAVNVNFGIGIASGPTAEAQALLDRIKAAQAAKRAEEAAEGQATAP